MRLVPLGVRGSTPAPGPDFVEFGGHTSCLAVYGDNESRPRLILDAGTGLRSLPTLLGGGQFRGDIVVSHLHWDHVQGLPFTPSIDHPDAEVTLHVPVPAIDVDPVSLLARAMSPPHFPIGPQGLLGRWQFLPLRPGRIDVGPAAIRIAPIEHKGGTTYGLRVTLDGVSVAYLPDHAVVGRAGDSALGLAEGVDLLLHDGQFLASETEVAVRYGHATLEAAMGFADECGAGQLVLTHHAPNRTDDQLRRLAATVTRTPGGRPVRFCRQDEPLLVRRPAGHRV